MVSLSDIVRVSEMHKILFMLFYQISCNLYGHVYFCPYELDIVWSYPLS